MTLGARISECRLEREPEFHAIAQQVLEKHRGVTLAEVISDDRTQRVSVARQRIMGALHAAGWGFPAIGDRMRRHHSTVIYHVGKARSWRP